MKFCQFQTPAEPTPQSTRIWCCSVWSVPARGALRPIRWLGPPHGRRCGDYCFRSETVTIDEFSLQHWLGGNLEGQPMLLCHGLLSTSCT